MISKTNRSYVIRNTPEKSKTRHHRQIMVRVFTLPGSATLPNVRTPYLHLRLSVIIRRTQRAVAKLVLDAAKLGEYLNLAREDLDRLPPLPLPPLKKSQPSWMKVDYAAPFTS